MAASTIPARTGSFTTGPGARMILYAAAALSLGAALVHLWVTPEHFEEWWGYGVFFLVVALCQGLGSVLLLRFPGRRIFLLGIYGNLGIVAMYVGTRTAGVPFVGPHAWHPEEVGVPDVAATAAELALVAALVALSGRLSRARLYFFLGALQALGVGLILHLLHSGMHDSQGINPILHWAQSSVLSIPLSVLSLLAATPISRRLATGLYGAGNHASRVLWAFVGAGAYAAAGIPTDSLAARHAEAGAFAGQAARDAGVTLGTAFLVLLAVALMRGAPWEEARALNWWRPRAFAAAAGLAVGVFALAGPSVLGYAFTEPARAQAASGCGPGASYDRSYDVAAVNVRIPYNRWGNVDPHGQMYVLQQDKAAVKNWSKPLADDPSQDPAGNRRLRPRPLVIRANAGECVKVDFTNELAAQGGDGLPNNPRASMKVFGPSYDAQTSDGSAVGFNEDTTVGMGETITYYWKAPDREGTFLFRDQGATAGSEANSGSLAHGLYGALVVEPAGSVWRDPVSGKQLYTETNGVSGDLYINADIVAPGEPAFRETIQLSQDELPGGFGFGFNYGAEPAFNRIATNPGGENELAGELVPDAIGEETSLSSWAYGDPSLVKLASGEGPWLTNGQRQSAEDCGLGKPGFNSDSCYVSNVTHAYPGDPTKIRFAHAGVKETHVFHMHAHQWRVEPDDPNSTTIDSQTWGPGESFTAELIGGAGSKPKTVGDSIFHCHLYPHFADGFWALFRVHDVLEDGTNKLPDGTNVRALKPLPSRAAPPAATAEKPGYPRFIPGKYGWRAPQPPGGISESNGQQDDPNTVKREDLSPATRVVAGRPLDLAQLGNATDAVSQELAEKLRLEQNAMRPGAKPGAPFTEPCPTGSREVTYNVSVIQTDLTYNERGDHDTQARIMVPTEDVEEILAGEKKTEPLFIRVNAGDCINFNLTNYLPNWFGGDAFVKIAQTNMVGGHIHLVKFDVLASDGSSNGWNYQQAAFTKDQADFNKRVLAGQESCTWNGCRLTNPATWDPTTKTNPVAPGQTLHERWYADYELRTVFTHDHHFAALDQNRGYFGALIVEPKNTNFRNPRTGEFYQPGNGNVPNAPNCGAECTGTAAGAAMDVIGPGAGDDFREFGLAVQDFVSLTRKGGNPANPAETINPPAAPEEFPDDDPGTMAVNYRNAPFQYRQEKDGQPVDPAYTFSSTVWGDPMTPVLETYSEDPVRIRLIQGSQEEQHVFSLHGMRWREEPDDPNSPLINSKPIGVSEAFNFEVPRIQCGPEDRSCIGDYLYSGTATDDLYLGVWGLLRARGNRVPSLLPLPDNVPQSGGVEAPPPGAIAPPPSSAPGNPCPTGAPVKRYSVVAMEAKIQYNKDGDNDPYGLVYAAVEPGETLAGAMDRARKDPEPMVLRANEGDCVEVRLYNKLTQQWLQDHGNAGTNGDPTLPTEPAQGTRAGLRVSLHPQLLKYDVRGSDGTAVGFNRDQTVAPGDSKLYRWYADDVSPGELGMVNLTDYGDVRGHRHHGLFAGLNIEPKGASYHDPRTGEQIRSGASADIRIPGADNDFREFTLFFQDGLNLRDGTGAIIEDPVDHPPAPGEPAEPMDAEDQGEKGFNYGNAPFANRIGDIPDTGMDGRTMADVFSSRVHGDPDTPIFRAYAGDKVRMRVLQGADKPRQNTFQLSGHSWLAQPGDPNSNLIGNQGGVSVGRAFNVQLGSAGGGHVGDYMYGTGVHGFQLWGGLWGILRTYPQPGPGMLNPSPVPAADDPRAPGNHPILPLEIPTSATGLTLNASPNTLLPAGATTLSGKLTKAGGEPLANRPVVIEQKPAGASGFTALPDGKLTTDGNGDFRLANVKPGKTTDYRARFAGNAGIGLKASTSAPRQVAVMRATVVTLAARPATVPIGKATTLSGKLTVGNRPVAGKQVILEQQPSGAARFTRVAAKATSKEGLFSFTGVKPLKNTTYRVRFAENRAGGLKAAEKTVAVKVRSRVSLAAASLNQGRSVKISGAVMPAHKGSVELAIKRDGKQVLSRNLALKSSRYGLTYRPKGAGRYTVVASFAGDAEHLGSSSPARTFAVRR